MPGLTRVVKPSSTSWSSVEAPGADCPVMNAARPGAGAAKTNTAGNYGEGSNAALTIGYRLRAVN